MSLIIWRPMLDESDKARFPYSHYPDSISLAAWTGRDMYDQEPLYVLEMLTKDKGGEERPSRFALITKFLSKDPTKRWRVEPAELSDDNIADAAGHMGFKFFRRECNPSGLTLIIEEYE